ncbi:NADH dehydrogenase [ubiquinone] 1 beta subcomplex subunit 4 [Danio rerio]|uniref:NADH dehydrogenase [ubiquinone] 1 beta subcomplex subunit 4 n=2 Tax=Bilateria TaxID=33213 RepID=Q6PBK0_DANRE|nr:NADH dehydrogenase [ubiquinone] 1 beta subcomplex subunit 4 [Danio rerio]AAH59680.1 NADH dehydrogenase (ubiquinone) 1 beta subcomplex, 4 [Danio rerio]|eukprot:NP_998198.1 NADH dehydrogenase [ubiquinone] 1 beta subcomplex subunit 4 [Danio rerio]
MSRLREYKPAPLATLPKTLDPDEYYNLSPEYRRAEEERTALRSQMKRQYQMQLNNPYRKELIEDPALTRWLHARNIVYPHFRPSTKSSLIGVAFGALPLVLLYFVLKTDRDKRDSKIDAGTYKRPFKLSS